MSEPTHIDLDSVRVIIQEIPLGTYEAVLLDVEAAISKAGKAMIKATWEITDGSYKGMTFIKFYSLSTFTNKNGNVGCMGVSEIKTDAVNLGVIKKIPASFPLDKEEARKIYAKAFTGVKAKAVIREEEYTDKEGDLKTSRKITLMAPGVAQSATTATNSNYA